jgi:hypothetical protein
MVWNSRERYWTLKREWKMLKVGLRAAGLQKGWVEK